MTEEIDDPFWWFYYPLFAPVIVWPGYEESSKQWVPKIQMARYKKILSGDKSERATDAEVATYLYTASLAIPLDETAALTYFRAARKAFPELNDVMKGFEDEDKEPTREEKEFYDSLAEWIFKQQLDAYHNHNLNSEQESAEQETAEKEIKGISLSSMLKKTPHLLPLMQKEPKTAEISPEPANKEFRKKKVKEPPEDENRLKA